ncbi:MAG: hypothetical protein RI826_10555 [Chlorobium phaeovibrioides]|nr:hypothetical protein [Chlorobium phaeovibrioides]
MTSQTALEAYARMINTGECEDFLGMLADDFQYTSTSVLVDITSAAEYGDYIRQKLIFLRKDTKSYPWAEMSIYRGDHVVVLHQGSMNSPVAVLFLSVEGKKVVKGFITNIVPHPSEPERSGIFPGVD